MFKKGFAVFLTAFMLLMPSAFAEKLGLYAGALKFDIDGTGYTLPEHIFLYRSNIYIPIDDPLKACGYDLGWDAELRAVVAIKDGVTSYILMDSNVMWVGEERCEFDQPTLMYRGVAYMSQAMFQRLTGCEMGLDGALEETKFQKRDLLLTTYPQNRFRYEAWGISEYGGFTFINQKHGMEILRIPQQQAEIYANLVNMTAARLPEVQVYALMVPNYSEFYAPETLAPDQASGIRTAYALMKPEVTPINVVAELYTHAGEKLYFDTDHHWTQRGAYYAYKAFAENKGWRLPPLDAYERHTHDGFVGSLANFAKGTAGERIARANPDLLEKFMPMSSNISAARYADQDMQEYLGPVQVVNPAAKEYASAFINGDNPLTVIVNPDARTDKKLVVLKESFGNAFATWAVDDYAEVYVIDPRKFNGFGGHEHRFDLRRFYEQIRFDDLIFINYPGGVTSVAYRQSIADML